MADIRICAHNTSIPAGIEFEQYWSDRPKKLRKELARLLRVLERDEIISSYKVKDRVDSIEKAFRGLL